MKGTAFILLMVLFSFSAAGLDYQTSLATSDLEKDFVIEGWILSESSNQTEVTLKYNLEFVNERYNHTKPDYFSVKLVDGDHVVAQENISFGKLVTGENVSKIVTVNSERPPDRITALEFESNHTMYKKSGESLQHISKGKIDFNPTEKDPEITGLESSTSVANRAQNISLRAYTEDISSLSVNGKQMKSNEEFFSGHVDVPRDIDAGGQPLRYDFKTGRGAHFTEKINLTVNNKAPEINLTVNESVLKGSSFEVKADIEDDREVVNTSLEFNDEIYDLKNGQAKIETTYLYAGEYSLELRAVDSDGAYSTETETIRLHSENNQGKTRSENHPENITDKESNKTTVQNNSEDGNHSAPNNNPGNTSDTEEDEGSDYQGFNELVVQPLKSFVTDLVNRF